MGRAPGVDRARRGDRRPRTDLGRIGHGKELVATAIISAARGATCPFVRVNCAAIPRDLSRARCRPRAGRIHGRHRAADRAIRARAYGGRCSSTRSAILSGAQAKLLRAIEASEIEHSAAASRSASTSASSRATNKDLPRTVADGTFREDLLFRLNVIPIVSSRRSGTSGRHSGAGATSLACIERARDARTVVDCGGRGPDRAVPLAGQRPRARQHRRAFGDLTRVRRLMLRARAGASIGRANASGRRPTPDPAALDRPLSDTLDDYERTLITRALSTLRQRCGSCRRLKTEPTQPVPAHAPLGIANRRRMTADPVCG